jgi:hypothetical protein
MEHACSDETCGGGANDPGCRLLIDDFVWYFERRAARAFLIVKIPRHRLEVGDFRWSFFEE